MNLSFIIIAYNEEQNICHALDSILLQEGLPKEYEVIVVNDGSRDSTASIVEGYTTKYPQVRLVSLIPNQGRGAARATGVEYARGKFFAFIDADIVLPENWLTSCMLYMDEYDACAGTAVPDGDVTWIYNRFRLTAKVANHATSVTGSNGLFKSSVFSKVSFMPNKKDGEDVDLGYQMASANINTARASGLIVEHHENKDYLESIHWLYQSGIGATKQLYEHHEIRVPDFSFFAFMLISLASLLTVVISSFHLAIIVSTVLFIALYLLLASTLHLHGKFYLRLISRTCLLAVIANSTLLLSYFCGRFIGLFSYSRPASREVQVNV
jgi:glycosyltransferase involved in cell wall biosynthesis